MRITIQITCDDVKDAQEVIAKLSRTHKTWVEMAETKTPESEPAPAPAPRLNVSPGESKITKLGSDTKEELLRILRDGGTPPERFIEHLRLLWARNEVKFDGANFYV